MVAVAPNSTIKFPCSYGRKIVPRYPDGKLRYLGGHTRVLSVPCSISLSELLLKMGELYGSPVSLRCQLPAEDLDALVSITSDEDLANLIEEYDRVASPSSALKIVEQGFFLFLLVVVFVQIILIHVVVVVVFFISQSYFCLWLLRSWFKQEVSRFAGHGRQDRTLHVSADGLCNLHRKVFWDEYSAPSLCLPCSENLWPHLPSPQREPLAIVLK